MQQNEHIKIQLKKSFYKYGFMLHVNKAHHVTDKTIHNGHYNTNPSEAAEIQ